MASTGDRLARLRGVLEQRGLAGFLVPRADEHQGEYVPPSAERLTHMTGFSGSAGIAAVLRDRAAIFVDGRYTLQAADQVDTGLIEVVPLAEKAPDAWLCEHLSEGDRLALDPWLHTRAGVQRLEKALRKIGAELAIDQGNLVDRIWDDRPAPPENPVEIHPLDLAGRASAEKRTEVAEQLTKAKVRAAVLSLPDSIAWLLNIRGSDIPNTPVVLSFAIVFDDGKVEWFVHPAKMTDAVRGWLDADVAIKDPGLFESALRSLGNEGASVRVDPATAPYAVSRILEGGGATVEEGPDPCLLPKATKNEAELAGSRAAHARDGAAVARFLHWLDEEGPKGGVTETSAADRLEGFRRETNQLKDLSFDTISGTGPNGAIVHYRVTPESDRAWGGGELYLVDSGAQYRDGTTDITRTVINGTPTDEMRDRYTRVLKGHIAIATAVFPEGTTGTQLDTLARLALWQAGLDFEHGTGHGVGSYLSVHEGPQGISKRPNGIALKPGMILSNEPGYYKRGGYGIRIENLVVVEPREIPGAEKTMLGFETLTFAPFDRRLIDPALLTGDERSWIDAYHAMVWEKLEGSLAGGARTWLAEAVRPI
ncbi:MAG: aminopeptidase P family protein [Alphaproteobacteria bacterium]|nr:aminopeptidase P family protein [Alphaproteobacteria bacterium]